jgi:hypothetical protein
MRTALRLALACLAALVVGASSSQAVPQATTSGVFVVRPDPRACPSPLCGGYWVSLANHARTRCHDGLLRPRCYAAEAIDATTRQPATVAAGALASGVLRPSDAPDFGKLGTLVVTAAWAPVTQEPAMGVFFRVRDTGIRCVRAPCYSMRATPLNTGTAAVRVSALVLGAGAGRRADAALRSVNGLLAAGRFEPTGNGGRLFRATQVYLRASKPRA